MTVNVQANPVANRRRHDKILLGEGVTGGHCVFRWGWLCISGCAPTKESQSGRENWHIYMPPHWVTLQARVAGVKHPKEGKSEPHEVLIL